MAGQSRVASLDGLRGVAILMVVLFHGYARWSGLYPFRDEFVGNPLLDTGSVGVDLFFAISGFVILMTLRRCPGFFVFMGKRWLRLFPAMLIASLLIYATADLLPDRPRGPISARDLLPGLSFIGLLPDQDFLWRWLEPVLGGHPWSIEESFWSLYVEMRFYVVFGAAYFLLGEWAAIGVIVALGLLNQAMPALGTLGTASRLDTLTDFLHARYYGWFAAGAVFYIYRARAERSRAILILAVLLLAWAVQQRPDHGAADLFVALLFALSQINQTVARVLANPALLLLGLISYPLYLIHENALVAIIVALGRAFPQAPWVLLPVGPILLLGAVAWVIAARLEPWTRIQIRRVYEPSPNLRNGPA